MYNFKEVWGFDGDEPSDDVFALKSQICFTEADEAYIPEPDDTGDFYDKLYCAGVAAIYRLR